MSERYLLEALKKHVAHRPNDVAVTDQNESLSYSEFYDRIESLAKSITGLSSYGAAVAVCMPRGINFVIAAYATWMANRVYVPMDANWPLSRKETVQVLSDAELLIESEGVRVLNPKQKGKTDSSHAYIIFTSGTTGEPKGVLVGHRAYENLVQEHHNKIYSPNGLVSGNVAMNASFCFDSSLERLALVALGYSLHVVSDEIRKSPQLLLEYLRDHNICNIDLVPSHLKLLLEVGLSSVSSLKLIIVGGEAIDGDLWKNLASIDATVFNVYGPTENTINTTIKKISGNEATIGKPLGGVECVVVNDAGDICDKEEPGELYVQGCHLAEGYYNNHERTLEAFVMFQGKRSYRTGDLVKRSSNGDLLFLGRLDDQIKISGYRIELEEVRKAIAALEGVSEVAVSVVKNSANNSALLASVVSSQGGQINVSTLKNKLAQFLPEYMVPVLWQEVTKIPLTDNLKLDHKSLVESWGSRASEESKSPSAQNSDAISERVKSVWEQVLGQPNLACDTHFFNIGDSIAAMNLMVALETHLGISLSLPDLFLHPTIDALSAHIKCKQMEVL
ncbi:non-ribosomal peptide synthetase [Vibrio caribbeanicus]|uniref:Amino acid adenylation domain-containing protein n=1 Tax=Vibrio caribbeanicus ATCC BAA-2122 TaxID=796620 RepID=E3BG38_9VIBR|nr:non-ribosomal peptide synthetase [Vibrio caribbeanicus]EFP97963.1 amino acid adenylation domain-containing protein [Vibrio caribbeanicus ATCC BAA-2122]